MRELIATRIEQHKEELQRTAQHLRELQARQQALLERSFILRGAIDALVDIAQEMTAVEDLESGELSVEEENGFWERDRNGSRAEAVLQAE